MTNTNEHDEAARLHQLLCAVVLGEADEHEAAEVERALEASPELRAERDRLRATIGMVETLKAGGGAGEALSPEIARTLNDAALARQQSLARPRPIWARPMFQVAASFAAIGLGYLVWSGGGPPAVTEMASAIDAKREAAPAGKDAFASNARSSAPSGEPERLSQLGYPDRSDAPREDGVSAEYDADLDALRSLGYASEPSPAAEGVAGGRFGGRKNPLVQGAAPESAGAAGVTLEEESGGAWRGAGDTVPPGVASPSADPVALGGQVRDELAARERSASGSTLFDGPTVVRHVGPASPGGPAGGSGPSTPGPSGPSHAQVQNHVIGLGGGASGEVKGRAYAGAVVTDAEDFFLDRAEPSDIPVVSRGESEPASDLRFAYTNAVVAERLKKLGYVDGEGALEGLGYVGGDDGPELGLPERRMLRELGYVELGEDSDDEERLRRAKEELAIVRLRDVLRRSLPDHVRTPRDMIFHYWGDNPFERAADDRLSTFAMDVDTASYALARRYLTEGALPPKAQVRTEEFVNYFEPDVPAPVEATFAVTTELAPSLFPSAVMAQEGRDTWTLRVAIRGREVSKTERQPLSLTFVIDVSGSMKQNGRLNLVKRALSMLVGELDLRDSVSVVVFSDEARVILPVTSARHTGVIEEALRQLEPGGHTNLAAGMRLGYELSAVNLAQGSLHRVVLLSDGVANTGETDREAILAAVEEHRQSGIYLNTVGVGMSNHNDALLEQLADRGDGMCNYVDDDAEAKRALVDRFTGAFEPIARDAKIQVEFDPTVVERYRLLGYENRAVADSDFRNDAVDGGEVGAGHQVVALYELVLRGSPSSGSLATVNLRWLPPHPGGVAAGAPTEGATEIAHDVRGTDVVASFAAASPGYRQSILAAELAEVLRRSIHAREVPLARLVEEAKRLAGTLGTDEMRELAAMTARAAELRVAELEGLSRTEAYVDAVQRARFLRARIEELRGHIDEVEEREELKDRIQDLLEQRDSDSMNELESLEGRIQELRRMLSELSARRLEER